MTRDVMLEAEQAVLGALMCDEQAWDDVVDLWRVEWFAAAPAHAEIATEIQVLAREQTAIDPVLVSNRLAARKAAVAPELVFGLARAIGTAANVRHYAEALESLWAKREAKRIAADMLRSDLDCSGEEFVGRFAERLSAIETKRSRPPRRLAEVMFSRLERREAIQKNPGLLQAWATGFPVLDALVGGFMPGQLFTIAARPGVGKTAFMTSVLKTLAAKKVPTGVFMLEDYADAVADRTLMREGGISSTLMRDSTRWGNESWRRAQSAVEAAADWPVYVDDQHGRTIHDIAGAMRRMAREHGVKVFFLDNLAEVVVDRDERGEERLDRALGRIAKTYRDAAHAVGAAPVLIAHLNRDVEKRAGKPRMSDLKNSGEIEDASHVVAMLTREKDSDTLIVNLEKNRQGPPGEVELFYDRALMEVRTRNAA
jgi:replicative DNA helicase